MRHHLDADQVHYEWNNAIPPRLEIEPGDTVVNAASNLMSLRPGRATSSRRTA